MIYLDNAATTKTAPEVVDAMLPYFSEYYGNASTIYSLGAESKKAMDHARQTIADSLGAVSYTHLDVYKRQHLCSVCRIVAIRH